MTTFLQCPSCNPLALRFRFYTHDGHKGEEGCARLCLSTSRMRTLFFHTEMISDSPALLLRAYNFKKWAPFICLLLGMFVHAHLCPILWGHMDCSLLGSSVHRIFQARILNGLSFPTYSRGSFQPRDLTRVSCVSCTGRWILYH